MKNVRVLSGSGLLRRAPRGVASSCPPDALPASCSQPGVSLLEALADSLVALAGTSLWLHPHCMHTRTHSVDWKVKLSSKPEYNLIVTWKNESVSGNTYFHSNFSDRFTFESKNLTLLIKDAQQQDSGLYVLEVTNNSGDVCRHQFCVSVFGESPGQLPAPSPAGLVFPALS